MVPIEDRNVVGVCGNEARIYGPVGLRGIRPLLRVIKCKTRGEAMQIANEIERH